MKKLLFILFLFTAFISNAQRTMFGGNNNYMAPVGPPPPPVVITNGLVLCLDATSSYSYSGGGSAWYDISGQDNNATLVGNPTFSSNPGSFSFNTNKHAITSNKSMNLSTATFIAWVNPSQTQNDWNAVIMTRANWGGGDIRATGMHLCSNNGIGYTWDNYAEHGCNGQLIVPNNEWSMIAVTFTANTATTYLLKSSGVTSVVYSRPNPAVSGIANFYIGCDPYDPSSIARAFVGKIATSLIYTRALTQTEITTIFDSQKVKFGL
jgi:hypothetical protein